MVFFEFFIDFFFSLLKRNFVQQFSFERKKKKKRSLLKEKEFLFEVNQLAREGEKVEKGEFPEKEEVIFIYFDFFEMEKRFEYWRQKN